VTTRGDDDLGRREVERRTLQYRRRLAERDEAVTVFVELLELGHQLHLPAGTRPPSHSAVGSRKGLAI